MFQRFRRYKRILWLIKILNIHESRFAYCQNFIFLKLTYEIRSHQRVDDVNVDRKCRYQRGNGDNSRFDHEDALDGLIVERLRVVRIVLI